MAKINEFKPMFRQLLIDWRLADPESDLCAVRSVSNLPMQIPEERQLFVQVGDVGVIWKFVLSAKNDGHLETDTLEIVRP